MLLGTDTSEDFEFWGRHDTKYGTGNDPSFIVFREDKQDVTKQQVEALSNYCRDVMFAALQDRPEGWDEDQKKAVLDAYCSAGEFTKYFDNFKQKKIIGGDKSWTNATPPPGMRISTLRNESARGVDRARVSTPTIGDNGLGAKGV